MLWREYCGALVGWAAARTVDARVTSCRCSIEGESGLRPPSLSSDKFRTVLYSDISCRISGETTNLTMVPGTLMSCQEKA